ncbi:DUF5693 family protein [Peptoniphilus mikwangii]|uniref:DUF5693 family protein n=1 Tax=Peptoniphilus mikwangii TaxID=1354300 RepID=UPI000400E826|nr:DUF5693 family protein [Peptoniphilus mikwangii]
MFNKKNIWILLILISIVSSFYFVSGRLKAESNYKNYDILADYDEFSKIGYDYFNTSREYFTALAKNGVSNVTINESTINSMKKMQGSKIKTGLVGNDLIVKGSEEDLKFIANGLKTLKKEEQRKIKFIDNNTMQIQGSPKDIVNYKSDAYDVLQNRIGDDGIRGSVLEYIGLGFDTRKIEDVKGIENLSINLRPTFYSRYQDSRACMNRFTEAVEKYNKSQRYVVFSGKEFYKNSEEDPKVQDDFASWLSKNKIALGMIEASNQRGHLAIDGIDSVIRRDSIGKIRVFTTWDYIQREYDYAIPMHHNGEELTNVYYRAISERNIVAIFIRPFIKNDLVISDPEKYGAVLENLQDRLDNKGYEVGNVNPIGSWNPNRTIGMLPIAIGTVAASILLLKLVFSISSIAAIVIFVIGALLSVVFFVLGKMQSTGTVLFNLAAIVTYPSLAICTILENYNRIARSRRKAGIVKIFIHGSAVLLISILISMIGSFMEVSFMSGTNYLVELNIFRGVKISQLLPLLVSIFIYAAYIGFGREKETDVKIRPYEITNMLSKNVKLWEAVLGIMVLGMLAVFIVRGGNSNTKVPGMELLFRNLLEQYLPARPRTKAIFIGYPAVILLMYIAYKKRGKLLTILLTIFAAIGMADIVNTFSHIRTPLTISFMRVAIEFVIALIVSIFVLIAAELVRKGYDKYIEK